MSKLCVAPVIRTKVPQAGFLEISLSIKLLRESVTTQTCLTWHIPHMGVKIVNEAYTSIPGYVSHRKCVWKKWPVS